MGTEEARWRLTEMARVRSRLAGEGRVSSPFKALIHLTSNNSTSSPDDLHELVLGAPNRGERV
jgi:hypothetical protein